MLALPTTNTATPPALSPFFCPGAVFVRLLVILMRKAGGWGVPPKGLWLGRGGCGLA